MANNVKTFTIQIDGVDKSIANLEELKTLLAENTSTVGGLKNNVEILNQAFEQAEFGTKEFKDLQSELFKVNSQVAQLDEEVTGLHIEAKLMAITDVASGVAGGFAAVQGAMALFGAESAALEETLVKVNAAMALTGGIQQLGVGLAKAKTAFTALGTAIKSALGPFGLLITAGVALAAATVGILKNLSNEQAERNKLIKQYKEQNDLTLQQKKLSAELDKEVVKELVTFDTLFKTLQKTNVGSSERKEIVGKLVAQYPEYLKNINLENAGQEALAAVYAKVRAQLIANVKAKAAALQADKLIQENQDVLIGQQEALERLQAELNDRVKTGNIDVAKSQEVLRAAISGNIELTGKLIEEVDPLFGPTGPLGQLANAASFASADVNKLTDRLEFLFKISGSGTKTLAKSTEDSLGRLLAAQREFQNVIATDETNFAGSRLQAIQTGYDLELTIAKREYDKQHKELKGNTTALAALDLEYLNQVQAINAKRLADTKAVNDKIEQIELDRQDRLRTEQEAEQARIESGLQQQEDDARAAEEANKERLDRLTSAQLDALNMQMNNQQQTLAVQTKNTNKYYDAQLEATDLAFQQGELTEQEYANAVVQINTDRNNKLKDLDQQRVQALVSIVQAGVQLLSNVFALLDQQGQAEIDKLDQVISDSKDRISQIDDSIKSSQNDLDRLSSNLATATAEQRGSVIASINAEMEAQKQLQAQKDQALQAEVVAENKKKELQREAFRRQKATSSIETIISTAQGVATAIAQAELFPFNFILAGLVGAAGAVQLGIINSQPEPFAVGGFTEKGSKHEVAGVVHKGEWVAPKWMVESPHFAGSIHELESARKTGVGRAEGGYSSSGFGGNDALGNALLQSNAAMIALANRPIITQVKDVNDSQDRVRKTQLRATL